MYKGITIKRIKQMQKMKKVWTIKLIGHSPKKEILELYNHDELLFATNLTGPTNMLFWWRILLGVILFECGLRHPDIIVACGIDGVDYLLKAAEKIGITVFIISDTEEAIKAYLGNMNVDEKRIQYCEIT